MLFLIIIACLGCVANAQTLNLCCPMKEVSGPNGSLAGVYRLHIGEVGPQNFPPECKDACVYRKESDPSGTNYCFMAGGGMESVCQSGDIGFTSPLPPIGGQVTPASSGSLGEFTNDRFCAIDQTHTMCAYPGVGSKCLADPQLKNGFSDVGRQMILDKHNELRSKVAKGEESGQPKASDMRALVWNSELEAVAQRWADQCTFGHDSNRAMLDGTSVGQNAYMSMSSQISTPEEMMTSMDNAVTAWYNEVTDPGFDPADIQPFKFGYGTGHYTQVVWAETSQVGCGWAYYSEGGWQRSLVVCNYAKAGNYGGQTMYQVGEPCSQCPSGTVCRDSDQLCVLQQ